MDSIILNIYFKEYLIIWRL